MQRDKSWELLYTSPRRCSLLFRFQQLLEFSSGSQLAALVVYVLCKRICFNGGSHDSCGWGIRIASIRKGRSVHNSTFIILKVITVKIMLLWCRARGRPDQKRTGTLCGMPGGHGVNVPVPVEEAPRTLSDDASVPSKATSQPLLTIKPVRNMCDNIVANTADDAHVFFYTV